MTKYLIVGGYANSGKTTFLNKLQEEYGDIPHYSTSKILHEFAEHLIRGLFTSVLYSSYDKQSNIRLRLQLWTTHSIIFDSINLDNRDFLITLAEKVLKSCFGTEFFPRQLIYKLDQDSAPIAIIETVGGDEYACMLRELECKRQSDILAVNLRHKDEEKGVDLRKLLEDGVELWWSKKEGYDQFVLDEIHDFLISCATI